MTGLMLKDLYVLKKSGLFMLVTVLLFMLMPSGLLKVLAVIYAAMMITNVIGFDERARWDRVAAAMPCGRKQVVLSRYVLGLLIVLVVAGLSTLSGLALAPLWERLFGMDRGQFDLNTMAGMCCSGLMFQALVLPFMHWLGVEKGRMAYLCCVCALMAVVFALNALPDVQTSLLRLLSAGGVWLFLAALALDLISCGISMRLYSRRSL